EWNPKDEMVCQLIDRLDSEHRIFIVDSGHEFGGESLLENIRGPVQKRICNNSHHLQAGHVGP
ncbi:MAG: hypothetical protein KGL95_14170, partial [Patescibacteria group bacterium]|nr:hypothetical protein [Patescibacteria group bacterium]